MEIYFYRQYSLALFTPKLRFVGKILNLAIWVTYGRYNKSGSGIQVIHFAMVEATINLIFF
jgi:hypothetical protein